MTTAKQEFASAPASEQLAPPFTGTQSRRKQPRILRRMLALDDFEDAARCYIPRPIFGYVRGGTETNASRRANREVWVMMDSGVRRGTDVLKALALGAQFVFVGRPFLYAAAIAGEAGVLHTIKLLREEIDRDMALIGITSLAEMRRELLRPPRGAHFMAP